MKGCIIKNEKISIKNVYNFIENMEEYNWLITDIECYPNNVEIARVLGENYCWIEGKKLKSLLEQEDFQWIWGVFSAFSPDIIFEEVLKYDYPYADGNQRFWENPVKIQHPLALLEIVAWDGRLILVISRKSEVIDKLIENIKYTLDLEEYNLK